MTPETDLSALDALVAGATAGPWETYGYGRPDMQGGYHLVRQVPPDAHGSLVDCRFPRDAELIATARTAFPALIAELREARERIAKLEALHDAVKRGCVADEEVALEEFEKP